MMPKTFKKNETRRSDRGFTLMELLVVLLIIVVLMALLFPIFQRAREDASQSSSITNLHEIGVNLQRYQLDHDGLSPPVLFGYAVDSYDTGTGTLIGPVAAMGSAYPNAILPQTHADAQLYFPGLYPAYINDWHVFVDPGDKAQDTDLAPATNFNVLCPNVDDACDGVASGTLVVAQHTTQHGTSALPGSFYALDSYDLSPEIVSKNSVNKAKLVPRYQTSWTCLETGNGACLTTAPAAPFAANYARQLRVPSPSGDVYVTCSTYFVNQTGKIIVLYEDGEAKALDAQQFIGSADGPDVPDISTLSSPNPNASTYNFWQLTEGN